MRSARGLTLVEVLVVVAILATLCGLLYPAFSAARAVASRKEGEVSEPHETAWLRTVKHDGHWFVGSFAYHAFHFVHHPDCPCQGRMAEKEMR